MPACVDPAALPDPTDLHEEQALAGLRPQLDAARWEQVCPDPVGQRPRCAIVADNVVVDAAADWRRWR